MAEEIQEAVQIIRVAYDGIEIAMKVGSGGIAAMQKAIDFLKGMLDYEKSLGKTSMRKLLLKGGDLQVLQFNTEDMKKVEKMAKKYGVLYSVLPDCNKKDGLSEVIFHTEAVPRVNMMIQKLKFGKIATFDDYLKNGDEKSLLSCGFSRFPAVSSKNPSACQGIFHLHSSDNRQMWQSYQT